MAALGALPASATDQFVSVEVLGLSGERLCEEQALPRSVEVLALREQLDEALPQGLSGSDQLLYDGAPLLDDRDRPFQDVGGTVHTISVVFSWSVRFSGAVLAEEVAIPEQDNMRRSRGRLPTPWAPIRRVHYADEAEQLLVERHLEPEHGIPRSIIGRQDTPHGLHGATADAEDGF